MEDPKDSVVSWVDEESSLRHSPWTRERTEEKKTSTKSVCHYNVVRLLPPEREISFPKATREFIKRIKCIYEDEGEDFGSDDFDNEALIKKFEVATELRQKRIVEVMRNVRRSRNVELCFLVDATGSMRPYIDGVRQSINYIVSKLTENAPSVDNDGDPVVKDLKLAFVAYRDFGVKRFEILDFTYSREEFTSFNESVKPISNADTVEDVLGGLETALGLSWSDNAATKVIFHICDAPCHGEEFHSGIYDRYLTGDPEGRNHTTLFSTLRSKGIQYHFGKITNDTDIMISKFSEAYGEAIVDFDIKKVVDIRDSVLSAVSTSVSTSIAKSMSTVIVKREVKIYTYVKEEPDWNTCVPQKGKFISYDFPKSIHDIKIDIPVNRCTPSSAEVLIAPHPFSKGAERVAFYGKDVSTFVTAPKGEPGCEPTLMHKQDYIVLKEYLHKGKGMNAARRYELSNQMQTIAAFLASKFVEDVANKVGIKKTIKFVKIKTLLLTGIHPRFMSCERRFANTDKFVRFTNNTDYNLLEENAAKHGVPTDFLQLVIAFSHWTYKASNRFFMVVDLEGIVSEMGNGETAVLLTDPAIHCKDLTRYGPMNHGEEGMRNFFSRHICNEYCERLGIKDFGLTE